MTTDICFFSFVKRVSRSAHVVIAPNWSSGSADDERDGKCECKFTITNPKDRVKRTAKPTKEEGCPAENGQISHRCDNTQSLVEKEWQSCLIILEI